MHCLVCCEYFACSELSIRPFRIFRSRHTREIETKKKSREIAINQDSFDLSGVRAVVHSIQINSIQWTSHSCSDRAIVWGSIPFSSSCQIDVDLNRPPYRKCALVPNGECHISALWRSILLFGYIKCFGTLNSVERLARPHSTRPKKCDFITLLYATMDQLPNTHCYWKCQYILLKKKKLWKKFEPLAFAHNSDHRRQWKYFNICVWLCVCVCGACEDAGTETDFSIPSICWACEWFRWVEQMTMMFWGMNGEQ